MHIKMRKTNHPALMICLLAMAHSIHGFPNLTLSERTKEDMEAYQETGNLNYYLFDTFIHM